MPTDTAPLSTDTYSYTAGTNRLASVRTGTGAAAPTRTIQYDARGNTAAETRSNGPAGAVSVTTAYDGYGRLTQYTRGTETLSFQYNGRDDRVAMTSASVGVRRYVYDPAGRVIGEYGFSAADVKAEFIWLSPEVANDNAFGGDDGIGGYAPLAVATPDSSGTVQLNWVHPNHLGVPLVTTDASGNPATTPGDYLAPGFPGQARVLADLYYNRYRDYDPTTGRYIQADPIGLAGGGNPYLYAGGNPMGRVDPLGLDILNLFPYEQPEFRGAAARQYWNLSPDIRNSMVHIFGHANSNPTIFCVRATTGPMCLGPDKFLDWLIAQNIDLHKPVMLWGCQAGRNGIGGTDSFAQQLSRLMKVKGYAGVVVGATENTRWDLGFLGTGTFTHRGYIGMRGNGRWRTFVGGNEQ